jgi:hypothetical protein
MSAPVPTRRALFGAAALIAGGATLAASSETGDDAALIATAREYLDHDAAIRRLDADGTEHPGETWDPLVDARNRAMDKVTETPASTQAGI